MAFDDTRGLPRNLQRPRSRNRFVDLFLDAAFSFTGPAQVGEHEGPQRGPRTEQEARNGYAQWDRVTVDGHTYLVERAPGGGRSDTWPSTPADPQATGTN